MMSPVVASRTSKPPPQGRVLVVEDEPEIARAYARILRAAGLSVEISFDAETGLGRLQKESFDALVTDLALPAADGMSLVRMLRAHEPDLPVVLMTAKPTLDSAIRSLEVGAFRYLVKPVDPDELFDVVCKAIRTGREARLQRKALAGIAQHEALASQHGALTKTFAGAMERIFMVAQPVVSVGQKRVVAYEALVRSADQAMPHPGALFDAADRLDAHHELGRAIRGCISRQIAPTLPEETLAFVNVHPTDLLDDQLYDPEGPLRALAGRAVLELTERGSLDRVPDLGSRVKRLRELGFKIAIDDLGAGYAGLTTFAHIEPEVAKIDMSLVRDVHRTPTKRRLIQSMGSFCADMGIQLVCEGVETKDERDALIELGCDLQQGYFFAKPSAPFARVEW